MKINLLILFLSFPLCKYCSAQLLCVYCYNQNDSISSGVNNLVSNGGFENGCFVGGRICPNATLHNCNITDWVCTGGGLSTYASTIDSNYGAVTQGNESVYFGNSFCKICSPVLNDTSCINNTACTATGFPVGYPISGTGYGGTSGVSLEQTITGLVVGNTYVLEFWAGGEKDTFGSFINSGLFAVDVGFGDIFLRDNPTLFGDTGTRYIVEFNATSTSHIIKFTNWGHICQDCTELVLDDVKLYTLAELSEAVPYCDVGVDDLLNGNNEISIYPNPTSNSFTVKNISSNETLLLQIINPIGEIIYTEKLFGKNEYVVDANFAKGIYFVRVKDVVRKLVVE